MLAVINPGGRDPNQTFPDGAGLPDDPGHAPINYHAYAACCSGGFYRRDADIPKNTAFVMVLLRRNGLSEALTSIRAAKKLGRKALISWKESGLHQVADALADAGRYSKFREICAEADGFISSTPELVPLYRAAGCAVGEFIPTPYPVDSAAWNFSVPLSERQGIFIGTREFGVPTRNHLLAVATACSLSAPVTVINPDGRSGEKLLRALSPNLNILSARYPYPQYLRLIARHRLVFQLDTSCVPGQVAGDALLTRTLCVGGNGAVDRIAFSIDSNDTVAEAAERASWLLSDDSLYQQHLAQSQEVAHRELSFRAVEARLKALFNS
jgi:hypothetical protein